MPRSAALASLLLLAACREDAPTPVAAPPTTTSAKECGPTWATAHRERWAGVCTAPSLVDSTRLATSAGAVPTDDPEGMYIRIGPDGVGPGEALPFAAKTYAERLREEIEKSRQMAEGKGEPWAGRFVLDIDRDAPLAVVDWVARALVAEKVEQGWIAFASDRRTKAPVHPELYARMKAQIETARPEERAMHAARAIEPIAAKCKPVNAAFASLAAMPGDERCEVLLARLADAFVECGCPDTEPEIMTWVQMLFGPADVPRAAYRELRVVIDPSLPARADVTWGEHAATLSPTATELRVPAASRATAGSSTPPADDR